MSEDMKKFEFEKEDVQIFLNTDPAEMSALLEYQRAYTRRRSLAVLAAILAENFDTAVMLTFHFSGAKIAPAVAIKHIRWLRARARFATGGPFRYVQTFMYELSEATAKPMFRLIVQLSPDVCKNLTENWLMGPAEMEPVTPEQMAAFVTELMALPSEAWPRCVPTWTSSADLRQSQLYAGVYSGPLTPPVE